MGIVIKVIGIIGFVVGLMFAWNYAEMWLWNNVLADVFVSVPQVSFWEMWGLSILAWALFGNKVYNRSKD
jgi:hypothetical protein